MLEVKLIGRTLFLDPGDLNPRADQLQGTDAEKLIETAGRICYDSFGIGRNSADYHRHIQDVGHGSVEEHAFFNFRIRGVSRSLTHELVRHRVGTAISQRSTRYVDESEAEYVFHPALKSYLEACPGSALAVYLAGSIAEARRAYKAIVSCIEPHLVSKGVDKATARKQARGAARNFLGNGIETELVWSANVRALLHVIDMRAAVPADAEIRELGVKLFVAVAPECPAYFSHLSRFRCTDGLGDIVRSTRPQ